MALSITQLLSLPPDLLLALLSSLTTHDLASLDSAISNHKQRKAFLSIIRGKHCSTPGTTTKTPNLASHLGYLRWLAMRGVGVISLSVHTR
eukprot:CAMPEP_0173341642 /NCGR_PEP_ID=MMETSP1144-20121109/9694_1 /TAXON_ID=483371 /ORGANISM="non described non described, Strain CCMP2298" /LENGTH=90 /DNA_ID=CAMNT_0014288005 /DNA_START=375 /DNA_END=644 /DNA_ORIENTATION=+